MPARRRARGARRAGASLGSRMAVLVVLVIAASIAVGSILAISGQSGGFRRAVDDGYVRLLAPWVDRSNATGARLVVVVASIPGPNISRGTLEQGLDQAVLDASAQATAVAALVPPTSRPDLAARVTGAFADRARAVAALRSTVDRLLQMNPLPIPGAPGAAGSEAVEPPPPAISSSQAQSEIDAAAQLLSTADDAYGRAAAALNRLDRGHELPRSSWTTAQLPPPPPPPTTTTTSTTSTTTTTQPGATTTTTAPPATSGSTTTTSSSTTTTSTSTTTTTLPLDTPGPLAPSSLSALAAAVLSSPSLAPVRRVIVSAFGIDPPAVGGGNGAFGQGCTATGPPPGQSGPSVLPPGTELSVTATVTDCGNVDETGVVVHAQLVGSSAAAGSAASSPALALRAGRSLSVSLTPLTTKRGASYTLTVSVSVPGLPADAPGATWTLPITTAS